MITLQNEELKVSINALGAQITSVLDVKTKTEYIWNADPTVWPYHAPNLFPIVGGLKNNQLHVNGQAYNLNRHGFARTSTFRKIEAAPHQAIFELRYNNETLKVYPYKFEFQVIYFLTKRTLKIIYKVINMDNKKIFYSVGAHPAFNVPLATGEKFEDYYLEFNQEEELISHSATGTGLFDGNTFAVPTYNKRVDLKRSLFEKDALVFKKLKSRTVTLKSNLSEKQVKVEFPHFNYLGIWTKANAPFVCIEPWLGCADAENFFGEFMDREGIQSLGVGHVSEAEYCITF